MNYYSVPKELNGKRIQVKKDGFVTIWENQLLTRTDAERIINPVVILNEVNTKKSNVKITIRGRFPREMSEVFDGWKF